MPYFPKNLRHIFFLSPTANILNLISFFLKNKITFNGFNQSSEIKYFRSDKVIEDKLNRKGPIKDPCGTPFKFFF